jgi:hypothetical protein
MAVSVLVLAGCSAGAGSEGQKVEIVAGGGSTKIDGSLRDLDVGADGAVRVLVDGGKAAIWQIGGDGAARKIPLGLDSAEQLAVAGDGTLYVSSGTGLWKVAADGKATQVVGNGQKGYTRDGEPATGPAGPISGVAVDGQGRVAYTESLTVGETLNSLVRRVEDGRVVTVAGTAESPSDLATALRKAADPPAGTRATGLALAGTCCTTLAAGDDGTLYVNGKSGVLAIEPGGGVRAVVAGRGRDTIKRAARPFQAEGPAIDAAPNLFGSAAPANLSFDAGELAISSWEKGTRPPDAFRWGGDLSEGQKAIVDAAFGADTDAATTWPEIRIVRKDGGITTAAWPARAGVIRGGLLYMGLSDPDRGVLVAKVKIS